MTSLTRPRNAILKQYARLFDFEGVKVTWTDEAASEIAREALHRKVGARGLRMILEEVDARPDVSRSREQEGEGTGNHRRDGPHPARSWFPWFWRRLAKQLERHGVNYAPAFTQATDSFGCPFST